MGLTSTSSGLSLLREKYSVEQNKNIPVIALAGNPNTGKSTVFNGLTGLRQHTGNWPGKTVTQAQGCFSHQGQEYMLVDLPGTYSLLANSTEEKIARDFICFARPDATIVVADATNLERNLNLVLQVMELTDNTILCLNLMDEAARKGIEIDLEGLEDSLKIPVIPAVARDMKGLAELKITLAAVVGGEKKISPLKIGYSPAIESAVNKISAELKKIPALSRFFDLHWLGLRLLEGDISILSSVRNLIFKENYQQLKREGLVQLDGNR